MNIPQYTRECQSRTHFFQNGRAAGAVADDFLNDRGAAFLFCIEYGKKMGKRKFP